jgi:hypothetical protein
VKTEVPVTRVGAAGLAPVLAALALTTAYGEVT